MTMKNDDASPSWVSMNLDSSAAYKSGTYNAIELVYETFAMHSNIFRTIWFYPCQAKAIASFIFFPAFDPEPIIHYSTEFNPFSIL